MIPREPALSLDIVNKNSDSMFEFRCHLLGNRDGRCGRLVVAAPVVLVDSKLASRGGTPGSAASAGGSSLSVSEVKGLAENNDTGRAITEIRDQLVGGRRIDSRSGPAASNALGETLSCARDAHGRSVSSKSRNKSSELHDEAALVRYK